MLPPVYQIYTISVFYFSIITTNDYSRRTGCLGWSRVGVVRSPRGLKVTGEQLDSRLSSFWDQDKRHLKEDCGRSRLDEGDAIGKKAWGRGILHLVFLHWHWHTCNQAPTDHTASRITSARILQNNHQDQKSFIQHT